MKFFLLLATALFLPLIVLAQPDPAIPDGENLSVPESWKVRLDRPDPDVVIGAEVDSVDIFFVNMTPGWHITTGPAAIFYHPEQMAEGDYTLESIIHLFDPGERREAYGIFMGGQNLEGDKIMYDYFLLRNSGEFLIKRRMGSETSIIQDWTASESVHMYGPESESSVENHLKVDVHNDTITFSVNGTEVHNVPRNAVMTDGIVGLRINHALNVHVSDLKVTPHQ
ncbi:MAG: hypothetical protein OXE59_00080 [Bacteroidetes bacterium]|nr:hypothetical protein [Bacteroidota bacterium]